MFSLSQCKRAPSVFSAGVFTVVHDSAVKMLMLSVPRTTLIAKSRPSSYIFLAWSPVMGPTLSSCKVQARWIVSSAVALRPNSSELKTFRVTCLWDFDPPSRR